jgi:dephospho-CoA kinase
MIKVGLTGGIGSGKSLICEIFSRLKVPIYYADINAGILTETDPVIRRELMALFGEEIYVNNSLNKNLMSTRIFHDRSLLKEVNKIIHPKVTANFKEWCTLHDGYPYVIEESAILFESNAYRAFDVYITVSTPKNLRMQRILKRKNMTIEKAKAIIRNQLPEQEKINLSHHVIINDGTKLVIPQVLHLHHLFTAQS